MLESWPICQVSQNIWHIRHIAEHVQCYAFSFALIMGCSTLNVMAGMA